MALSQLQELYNNNLTYVLNCIKTRYGTKSNYNKYGIVIPSSAYIFRHITISYLTTANRGHDCFNGPVSAFVPAL